MKCHLAEHKLELHIAAILLYSLLLYHKCCEKSVSMLSDEHSLTSMRPLRFDYNSIGFQIIYKIKNIQIKFSRNAILNQNLEIYGNS